MVAKGVNMEALSPRDANALRPRTNDLKPKAVAQLKSAREKDLPPPPPLSVTEPACTDRREGAVYQVGKVLGKGGFAVCYEGKLAGTSKRYALKIVKSQMPSKMEQKFQTELQIHSKMRQQNIVQFHRAFSFENCTYLVLELCPNGSLMDLVKRRKGLTEPEVRYYSVQIAGAIRYMHSKGIIHRDLKMGNIFLDRHMNAKIGDFGLAALLVTGRDMQTIRRTTLCGTPNYIAPEILEKGRKGHDHMVDIWSLGIIMFAMFTSKPPFQSSTTDEIYRRARERDYEWPAPDTPQKYISPGAKELVAMMLQDADRRPTPDEIVEDDFFVCGYMPVPEDITVKLRDFPPDRSCFYERTTTAQTLERNRRNLREMCRSCAVGPWNEPRPVLKKIWRECTEEEQHGLTPIIPLAPGIVYRPLDEVRHEQRLQGRLAAQQSPAPRQADGTTGEPGGPAQGANPPKAPSGLLRAPPQSFAAQQRAQNKPTSAGGGPRAPLATEPTSAETGAALRARARNDVAAARRGDEAAPAPRATTRSLRAQLSSSRPQPPPDRQPSQRSQQSRSSRQDQQQRSSRQDDAEDKATLFSPSESQEEVPGTRPDLVLDRLRKLQSELERALNARSMAIVSPRDKAPPIPRIVVKWVDYTNKFGLGYILNDGSVGCILRSIPTQDGHRPGLLPPACMLIHGAERHCLRKDDATYVDRHQIVPMTEGIYFYENNGEAGLARVRVAPEAFRIPASPDGTAGKLSAGRDIYDHRKRERVVLWKKFANYMIAYGREIEGPDQADDHALQIPTITDPAAAPSDIVTFYQRFGDVGCWMFCDGHMQFNFPDHTKIVLDATGTWCHFWHLPLEAARRLEETGSLDESALDGRAVLSYPLQTLLNFSTVPRRQASASASGGSSSSRRQRPEIEPALRGIPAANQLRRKIEFIRDAVREWSANAGLGNSDMARARRLRWAGPRETCGAGPSKHVWVTIGARWGDQRLSAMVDPSNPTELGPDIDEGRGKAR